MGQGDAQRVGICLFDYEMFWWRADDGESCPVCSVDDPDYEEMHRFFVAEARYERLERILYPGPAFACIVDESAGLREGAEMSGVLHDAADKLTEVSNKLAGIDLSQEKEKAVETVQAAAAALGEIEATIRTFVERFGDQQSMPDPGEVANEPEAEEPAAEAEAEAGA